MHERLGSWNVERDAESLSTAKHIDDSHSPMTPTQQNPRSGQVCRKRRPAYIFVRPREDGKVPNDTDVVKRPTAKHLLKLVHIRERGLARFDRDEMS